MKHGHEKPFDPHCLHCLVDYTVEAWASKNGRREDGGIRLDAAIVIRHLSAVIGELVYHARDAATRRQFERYAHSCLERAFHAESNGNVVVISFGKDAA
jgi:hypothetical protein